MHFKIREHMLPGAKTPFQHLYAYKGNIVLYTYVIVIVFRCLQTEHQESPHLFQKVAYEKLTHKCYYQVSFSFKTWHTHYVKDV